LPADKDWLRIITPRYDVEGEFDGHSMNYQIAWIFRRLVGLIRGEAAMPFDDDLLNAVLD
jgi:hypothetical protein